MKNVLVGLMLLLLTACGVDTSQQLKGEYRIEFHTQVAQSDNIRATLKSVENKEDEFIDEYKEVTFYVENISPHPIEVQAYNIYIDGKRINQGSGIMSQEVKPGSKEECILTLQDYTGSSLPPLKEKIELELHIFSWNEEISEDHYVEIIL